MVRHHWPASIRDTIIKRLEDGTPLRVLCREDGMPVRANVQTWRRIDPGFDAAVRAALAVGAEAAGPKARKPVGYDEDVAQALVARLEAGAPINDVLRDPAMPNWRDYRRWRRAVPAFAEAVEDVNRRRRAQKRARMRGRWRAYDHAVAMRICDAVAAGAAMRRLLATDRAFPALAVLARWRRERPDFEATLQAAMRLGRTRRPAGVMTPAARAEVLARLEDGGSLRSVTRDMGSPSMGTLRAWIGRDPDFAEAVNAACDRRDERLGDLACDAVVGWMRGADGAAAAYGSARARYEQVTRRRGRWRR